MLHKDEIEVDIPAGGARCDCSQSCPFPQPTVSQALPTHKELNNRSWLIIVTSSLVVFNGSDGKWETACQIHLECR